MNDFAASVVGHNVEVLLAMATVRELSRGCNQALDLYLQPHNEGLVPLLKQQHYVADIYTAVEPIRKEYTQRFDLTLPRLDMSTPLIDQFGAPFKIKLFEPLPYIEVADAQELGTQVLLATTGATHLDVGAGALNDDFLKWLRHQLRDRALFEDVSKHSWLQAAQSMQQADVFIGDSQFAVLAHALGKPVLLYEPRALYRQPGFSNPYGKTYTHNDVHQYAAFLEQFNRMVEEAAEAKKVKIHD